MVAPSTCFAAGSNGSLMADHQQDGHHDLPDIGKCVNCEIGVATVQCVQCSSLRSSDPPKAICESCLATGKLMVGKVKSGEFFCLWCSSKEAEMSFDAFRTSFIRTWAIGGLPEVVLQVAPWYPVILDASTEEKAASLRAIKYVLPSRESSFAEALMSQREGQHLVNLMAVNLSHAPSTSPTELNSFTKKVLESAAQKYGVHRKYADLLLPEKGGSLAVARDHFRSVLAAKSSPLTIAMCQERLFILDEIANRYTPSPKLSQKVSPPVSCRREGLVVCLSLFRTLSREIKNSSQTPSDASAVFDSMYTSRLLKAWNRSAPLPSQQEIHGPQVVPQQQSSKPQEFSGDTPASSDPPTKRQKKQHMSSPKNRPGFKGPKSSQSNPVVPFTQPVPPNTRRTPCPNCLRTGTRVFHTLSVCHFLGNACRIPCGAKLPGGSNCEGIHWRAACPSVKSSNA